MLKTSSEMAFALHPAWAALADPAQDSLSWRRAACRDPEGCAPSERDSGGLLKLLQSDKTPAAQRLAVPATHAWRNIYIALSRMSRRALRLRLRLWLLCGLTERRNVILRL